jgi:predicted PurR-regulated permease PerM
MAMTREQAFAAFFFLVLALLLYQFYAMFKEFFGPIAWAMVFALAFYPAYRLLAARLHGRNAAALIMTIVIFVLVAVPLATLGGVIVSQTQNFINVVNEKAASGEARRWIESLRSNRVGNLVSRVLPSRLAESVDLTDLGVRGAQRASEALLSQLGGVARNVAGFLLDFSLMLFVLFYFFRDGRRLYLNFRDLLPMEPEHKDAIFGHLYETLAAVVQGMTATAALHGLLCGVAYWALGLPFALLATFASFAAGFFPIGGSAFIWVPAAVYLLVQGAWARAIILSVWGTLVVTIIDNLVRPMVIGTRARVPTLFLLLGILGGLDAYGVIGIFLGPVLIAIIMTVLRIYREEYAEPLEDAE